MSEGKPGRKRIGKQIKIRVPLPVQQYLEDVRLAQGLPDISAAGRLVLTDAWENRRFLAPHINARIVSE